MADEKFKKLLETLLRRESRKLGANEALARKEEREHLREMQDLYEKEAREKSNEETWWGRRKIGAKHWGKRQSKRVKRAPKNAYHGMRRSASGLPGGAAAIAAPEMAIAEEGMEVLEQIKKQAEETKKKVKHFLRNFIIFIFIIIIAFLVYRYFFQTTTGTGILAGTGGIGADITNFGRESGAVKTLNQFKMIMTGEYDPSQLWSSKTYEDKYALEDTGVELSEVNSFRETFLSGQEIAIAGNIKVSSLPEEDITAEIDAEWAKLELKKFSGRLHDWVCEPSVIPKQNLFVGRFICKHDAIDVESGLTESF